MNTSSREMPSVNMNLHDIFDLLRKIFYSKMKYFKLISKA